MRDAPGRWQPPETELLTAEAAAQLELDEASSELRMNVPIAIQTHWIVSWDWAAEWIGLAPGRFRCGEARLTERDSRELHQSSS